MSWKCKICGEWNDDTDTFCKKCNYSRGLTPQPGRVGRVTRRIGNAGSSAKNKVSNVGSGAKNRITGVGSKIKGAGSKVKNKIKKPVTPAPQPPGPSTSTPSPAPHEIQCPSCQNNYPANESNCPICGAPKNSSDVVICPSCRSHYNKNQDNCPFCNTKNPFKIKKEKPKSMREQTAKRIGPRLYEMLGSMLIGIFLYLGTPMLGLPSFGWLAFAFIVFVPIHIFLPGQREFLASVHEGEVGSMASWGGSSILLKSVCKLMAYILIIVELFAVNRLVSLIVAFVMYFTLPTKYKTSQPYKALEAWMRMLLGFYMAALFYMTFGGVGFFPVIGSGNTVANSLFWMGLAFFATLPRQEEADEDETRIRVEVYNKITSSNSFKGVESVLFGILMVISLFSFTNGLNFQFEMMHMIFYALWLMSLFIGVSSGPEARPAMGIITILIAMFVFSSTYTGVIGQAIFGYWWPQVQSGVETIFAPMDEMLFQAQNGMSDAWLMMTNPQAYLQSQQQNQQVTTSSSIGTRNSIEVDKFELASNVLDPSIETLFGDINLKNEGEFNADYIKMTLSAIWKDPVAENSDPYLNVGSISKMTCSGGVDPIQSGNSMYCEWVGDSTRPAAYPTETTFASFFFDKENWISEAGDDLSECCKVLELDGETSKCEDNKVPCSVDTSYVHSGETVKIRAEYDYNYNVNVSIPIEVIPFAEYERLISSKQISLGELRSEYTGGPVKATIYSREQPVKDGELSFIRASLYNEGKGNITGISNFTILVPTILKPKETEHTFRSCTDWKESGDFSYITCTYTVDYSENSLYPEIERSKYRTVVFMIKPDIKTDYSQTSLITGIASYRYSMTKDIGIQIASAPFA